MLTLPVVSLPYETTKFAGRYIEDIAKIYTP